jgi:hypothetical protein
MTTPSEAPATTPEPEQPEQPDQPQVPEQPGQRRVGLWGATASGKSTFLSALFIAAVRSSADLRVKGVNNESTDFLRRNTHILNAQHRFPPPTQAQQPLSWMLQMSVPNPTRSRWRRGPATVPFDFRIDLQDVPGRSYAAVPATERLDLGGGDPVPGGARLDLPDGSGGIGEDGEETPEVADYLAGCQGLLLLIDPLRERDLGDAHEYFHGTLLSIAQRVEVPPGQRLPHFVAVCVTKFDDPSVFRFARDNEFLSYAEYDPFMFPRVHDYEAERFLRELFAGSALSDVELVVGALRQYFYPERIRYFITSAVGFYVGRSGEFREDDYQNVVPTEDGSYAIRGQIHPINVAEPLLWLGERIAVEG